MKLWLAERETFYPVEIHTANPVGRANMEKNGYATGCCTASEGGV